MVKPPMSREPTPKSCADGLSEKKPPAVDLAALISEYHAAIYRYAYRLTGSEMDAEDLTQHTFMIAHQKLYQLRDTEKVRSWLYSVLRNCYFKSRRGPSPTTVTSLQLDLDNFPDYSADIDHVDRELLQAALNELPDEFKLVLTMFYYEDCSYKDIAAQLDIPIGTVMSRLARAKSRLRLRLSKSGATENRKDQVGRRDVQRPSDLSNPSGFPSQTFGQ